jgi:exosortase A-associated hydrolase 2
MSVQPFFFGPPQGRLYGCYHPPRPGSELRETAVVLCYPMGHEYIRCHRALGQLAIRLAGSGFGVLRFDYRGCGDSAGESHQASLSDWLDDIAAATSELRARDGSRRICLVGLRLGATLGMMVGARGGNIDSMILWDPVVEGRPYLEEIRSIDAVHREELGYNGGAAAKGLLVEDCSEILGFAFADKTLAEIEQLDLTEVGRKPARHILFIDSAAETSESRLGEHLESLGVKLETKHLPLGPGFWLAEPYKAVVPHESIQALVGWMTQEQA